MSSVKEIYSHKKFNSGYNHKKFGTRTIQRNVEAVNNEDITSAQRQHKQQLSEATNLNDAKRSTSPKDIFRPYALGDDTPRKRKVKTISEKRAQQQKVQENHTQKKYPSQQKPPQVVYSNQQINAPVYQQQQHYPMNNCGTPYLPLNKQVLTLMLQKQRAAFYMSNLLRYNNANAQNIWPTFLPPTPIQMPPTLLPTMIGNGC